MRCESCLVKIALFYLDLQVVAIRIQRGEKLRLTVRVNALVDACQWMVIPDGDFRELSVVNKRA